MASWVDIANMIGAHVGTETRVTSPTDNRTLARAIRAVWNLQRQAAIRDGSWNFSSRRARLAALAAAPAHGFAYQYQAPAGCLRLLEVNDDDADDRYQIEGGKILCDVTGPLDIRYAVDVEEPAEWDALFVEAFALRVAWAIGTKIAGSSFDTNKIWRSYQGVLPRAKRVDAGENPPLEQDESEWILARHSGSGGTMAAGELPD